MMHHLDVIRRLLADGWVRNHVKGSYYQFKHPRKPGRVTVPHPNRDFAGGTWALVRVDLSKLASKTKQINITMPERVLLLVDEQARREG